MCALASGYQAYIDQFDDAIKCRYRFRLVTHFHRSFFCPIALSVYFLYGCLFLCVRYSLDAFVYK